MNSSVHYTVCPVCGSRSIDPLLTVKDYSVSGEKFVIWQCWDCSLRFTQDAPAEDAIGRYYQSPDYISHTNIRKGLLNKLYQQVRQVTLNTKAELIMRSTELQRGSILDVGCGVGAFLQVMKERGWHITGIEPDAEARKIGTQTFGVEAQDAPALYQLPLHSFNAITLWHVLEHVHELHGYIEVLKNLLAPNGKLFIAVPNYQSLDAHIYRLAWAAYDVPRHLYHFTPKAMEVLMQKHGLQVEAKKPMWFDSFYISLLSSKYRKGTTNWIGAFFSGLRSNITALANKDRCSSVIYIISK